MLNVEIHPLGPLGTNCYIITDETSAKGIIVDPGMNPEPIIGRLEGLQIEAILLTHAHFDHIGGLDQVRKITNAPVYIHPLEQDWLTDPKLNGSAAWREIAGEIKTARAEKEVKHGDRLELLGETFEVFHTPGHSPGSVTFVSGQHCFSGDALFAGSIGRTDLPGGDHGTLIRSIRENLLTLPDTTLVYPGHGPSTTIGREKESNPFVGQEFGKPQKYRFPIDCTL